MLLAEHYFFELACIILEMALPLRDPQIDAEPDPRKREQMFKSRYGGEHVAFRAYDKPRGHQSIADSLALEKAGKDTGLKITKGWLPQAKKGETLPDIFSVKAGNGFIVFRIQNDLMRGGGFAVYPKTFLLPNQRVPQALDWSQIDSIGSGGQVKIQRKQSAPKPKKTYEREWEKVKSSPYFDLIPEILGDVDVPEEVQLKGVISKLSQSPEPLDELEDLFQKFRKSPKMRLALVKQVNSLNQGVKQLVGESLKLKLRHNRNTTKG